MPGFGRKAALTLIAVMGSAAQRQALPVPNAAALPAKLGFYNAGEALIRPRQPCLREAPGRPETLR